MRSYEALHQSPRLNLLGSSTLAGIERPDTFHERFLESAADGHRLAHRLHLRPESFFCARELLELPFRNLDNHVIDGRLEAGRRLPRDVVGNFVERVADREASGNLRNGKSCRL